MARERDISRHADAAADLRQLAADRSAAIRRGDDTMLAAAREVRSVSRANDGAFWREAERRQELRVAPQRASEERAAAAERRVPTGPAAALRPGGPLAEAGVRTDTLWEGPFDLDWTVAALHELQGVTVPAGMEIVRSPAPVDGVARVVLVDSVIESIAHAQFDVARARRSVYVAVRCEMTARHQADLARTLGGVLGRSGRSHPGLEVVAAFPTTSKGAEKAKASKVCVPPAVTWVSEVPPAGRRSWTEALAVMDIGRTPERDRARGRTKGPALGLGGPGHST